MITYDPVMLRMKWEYVPLPLSARIVFANMDPPAILERADDADAARLMLAADTDEELPGDDPWEETECEP